MDFLSLFLGIVFGTLIPTLFLTFLPNDKIRAAGLAWGAKASKWMRNKIGAANWESIENNFTGGLLTLVNAIKEGADSDD